MSTAISTATSTSPRANTSTTTEALPITIVVSAGSIDVRPHDLKVQWGFCGQIVWSVFDGTFDQNPGITFTDPQAPFRLVSSSLTTCIYERCNDNAANTGIPFNYEIHAAGMTGPRLDDPTVENDPPPPDDDGTK